MSQTTDLEPPIADADAAIAAPRTVADMLNPLGGDIAGVDDTMPLEQVMQVYERIQVVKAIVRELNAGMNQVLADWINTNGDFCVGDKRYYVGATRTTKVRDKRQAVQVLLEATAGDLDSLADLLGSQPFKHGSCKQHLTEDQYDDLFEVVESKDIKTGKPKKGLQVLDTRFLKG